MKRSKWISLTWILLNEHYGFSKNHRRYWVDKKDLWEPIMILCVVIGVGFGVVPLFIAFLEQMFLAYSFMNAPYMLYINFYLISSLFGFVIGLLVVLGVFFFSKDLQVLLPLPLKARDIVSSKLFLVIIDQMWISLIALLLPFFYVGIRMQAGWEYWISGSVVFLLSQVFPLLLETLIILPLSRIIKFSKHRDFMLFFASILFVVAILGFEFLINSKALSGELTQEAMQQYLRNPDNIFSKTLSVYPPAWWAYQAVRFKGMESAAWLALFVCVHIFSFFAVLLFSQKFYLSSYLDLQEKASRKKVLDTSAFQKKLSHSRTRLKALFIREWRYFLRIPAFAFNGFGNVLIFPILLVLFSGVQSNIGNLNSIREITQLIGSLKVYILPIGTLVAILAGGINLLSSTIISREGKMIQELKVLPVKVEDICLAKYLQVFIMSEIGPFSAVIALKMLFDIHWVQMLLIFISSTLIISFLNLLQMIMDIKRPLLDWDNPQKAMKQNLNGLFSVLIVFGFVGLCAAVGILSRKWLPPYWMQSLLFCTGILGNLLFWKPVSKAMAKFLQKDL